MHSSSNHHTHKENHKQSNIKLFFSKYYKMLIILIFILLVLLAFYIDFKNKNVEYYEKPSNSINNVNNYDAIITIVDGEGEISFTETWGSLISEGYPICSDIVVDWVGKEGYMDWETIKALNHVGVEFVFHSSAHRSYNDMSTDEMVFDIERGIEEMDKNGIPHRSIVWLSNTSKEDCDLGKKYFDIGITDYGETTNTVLGEKDNMMMVHDIFGSSDSSYFTYEQLINLIINAKQNNGWVVLFTRNNHKMMDETQIDIYRQAFEYAKEHNVAVVTASEGYDLYYGNKLGNN